LIFLDAKRVHHRTGAGLQTAAERSQQRERQGFCDLDQIALGSERIGRERGLAEKVSAYIVLRKSVAAVAPGKAEVQVGEMRAVSRFSGPASRAAPAGLIGQPRVVAALDLPDRTADRFDHPRALVTEHDRPAGTGLTDVDIRVTDAASDDA